MTEEEEVLRIYRNHVSWYGTVRGEHDQHRSFYADDAWAATSERRSIPVTGDAIASRRPEGRVNRVQINLVRPWVTSFIASLYYRGIKFTVVPDERVNKLDKKERLQVGAAIAGELGRFFDIEDSADAAERLFTMGLLYRGGAAFKVGVAPENELIKDAPVDRIWLEAIPPYECVWDRKARSRRTVKHMGHLYVMSKDMAAAEFNGVPADAPGIPLADVIKNGFTTNVPGKDSDDSYLRILELTCFEEVVQVGGKKAQGEHTVWLVQGEAESETLVELSRNAAAMASPTGRPLSNLVPFISEPAAEAPMDSYAPARSVVEINAEYNIANSVVSEAFRRDSNRIVLYLKNAGLSEEDIARIVNGEDLELVAVDAETLEGLFRHLELPPVSSTLLEYIKLLQDGVDRIQLVADFARGKAGNYLSATEAANLVNYTETTIGRIRKRMDASISRTAGLYLRALRAEMGAAIEIDVDGETVKIEKKHLDMRWKIQVIDTASTPAAASQKMADIGAATPVLLELTERMEAGGFPGTMAEEILTIMGGLLNLPPSMLPAAIKAATPPPPPPPPPPGPPSNQVPPGAEAGGLQPGDVANGPVGQAIMQQAEVEAV